MMKFLKVSSPLYVSSAALVAANLIPLAGALFWNWELFEIAFLYWFESAIVGFSTILKMAWIELAPAKTGVALSRKRVLIFLFQALIVFLPLAAFMAVHFFFIYIFGREVDSGLSFPQSIPDLVSDSLLLAFPFLMFWGLIKILPTMALPALALFVSHGISFWHNFVGKQEYMRFERAGEIVSAPYERIFFMQFTVIGGLILMSQFGAPVLFVAALILSKTFVDLRAHVREHSFITGATALRRMLRHNLAHLFVK